MAAEEASFVQGVISTAERGMPPIMAYTLHIASLLLAERGKSPVGENWVRKSVQRYDGRKTKYLRRYDY